MQLPEYFNQLYAYNRWANQRVLCVAIQLSAEQLRQDHAQGWGSVHHTLVHIMNAEWVWLQRWLGHSPQEWMPFDDFPTVKVLQERWIGITNDSQAFVGSQTSESLEQILSYTNMRGQPHWAPLWLLLGHLVNHGTHHRGELAAMFSVLDVPHQENDFYYFHLIRDGQMED